jgi:hypothetical protein
MEPGRTPKIPIVVVAWHDAATRMHGEISPGDPPQHVGVILWTVGWLIRDDAEGVVLGVEVSENDGSFRHIVEIPRAYIKRVRKLTRSSVALYTDHVPAASLPSEGGGNVASL